MKNSIVRALGQRLRGINFTNSGSFYWSPKTKTIHYKASMLETESGKWSLIHEAGHARLNHKSYQNDLGLLQLEVEAWQTAEELAQALGLIIDADHIQECLDTYRDWLYARSTCPTCELNSLQVGETEYACMNCNTQWFVSQSRFCRPYRMQGRDKKTPPELPQTMFV